MSLSTVSLLKNRLTYLTLSFTLLVIAFPLISIGTTQGPIWFWWLGFGLLIVGGIIPPVYRVVSRSSTEVASSTPSAPSASTTPSDQSDTTSDDQKSARH